MPTSGFPGDVEDERIEDIRDRLMGLAAAGKIKRTEKYLKGASAKQLERVAAEYDRQQTEAVDDLVSKHIVGALSSLMRNMEYIDEEECEEMRKTLLDNDLVRRDLGNLSGYFTRNIKYIGIATAVVIAGGYVIAKRYGKQAEREPEPRWEPEIGPSGEDQQDDQ